jgi:hypothetical protein
VSDKNVRLASEIGQPVMLHPTFTGMNSAGFAYGQDIHLHRDAVWDGTLNIGRR